MKNKTHQIIKKYFGKQIRIKSGLTNSYFID